MMKMAAKFGGPILGIAISLLFNTGASAFECQDLPLMQLRLQDGTMVRIFALDEQIDGTKRWQMEEKGDPPLALSRALKIARNWAAKNYPQFDEVRIARISLNERRCGFSRDQWFYVFDFDPFQDGKLQLGTEHFVAILMDGTVIPPNDPPSTD
jgi:hypothetical protein